MHGGGRGEDTARTLNMFRELGNRNGVKRTKRRLEIAVNAKSHYSRDAIHKNQLACCGDMGIKQGVLLHMVSTMVHMSDSVASFVLGKSMRVNRFLLEHCPAVE